MGGKHLKRLRAEKAKVQLKKKTLPKGQNITNTNFKFKQIHIQKQLKPNQVGEVVTSKNLSLKDLFGNLQHYNTTTRSNAINGIKEIVKDHSEILDGSKLKDIIGHVLQVVVDEEKAVRVAATGLLSDILSKLSPEQRQPYGDILSVHVNCAMTHINARIQKDSLALLDVVVTHMPYVIKEYSKIIMRNYIRLLTNYKYGSHLEGLLTKGSKKELQKTKLDILKKLYQILSIVFEQEKQVCSSVMEVSYAEQKSIALRTLDSRHREIPNLSCFVKTGTPEAGTIGVPEEGKDLETLTGLIIPMLLDAWAEFAPNRDKQNVSYGCHIGQFTGSVLEAILKIIDLLFKQICQYDVNNHSKLREWFIGIYGMKFGQRFMCSFPYLPLDSESSKGVNGLDTAGGHASTFAATNLTLCFLYYSFHLNQRQSFEDEATIEQFIYDALLSENKKTVTSNITCNLLQLLLTSPQLVQNRRRTEKLLSVCIAAYQASSSTDLRKGLFKVLATVAGMDNMDYLQENRDLNRWMSSLPDLLLKSFVPLFTVSVISKLIQKHRLPVLKALNEHASAIIAALPNLSVNGVPTVKGQHMVANMLFYCDHDVVMSSLDSLVRSQEYPQYLRNYLLQILFPC